MVTYREHLCPNPPPKKNVIIIILFVIKLKAVKNKPKVFHNWQLKGRKKINTKTDRQTDRQTD